MKTEDGRPKYEEETFSNVLPPRLILCKSLFYRTILIACGIANHAFFE